MVVRSQHHHACSCFQTGRTWKGTHRAARLTLQCRRMSSVWALATENQLQVIKANKILPKVMDITDVVGSFVILPTMSGLPCASRSAPRAGAAPRRSIAPMQPAQPNNLKICPASSARKESILTQSQETDCLEIHQSWFYQRICCTILQTEDMRSRFPVSRDSEEA